MVELKTLKSKEGNLKGCPEKNLKESTLYVGIRVRGVKCKNYLFSDHGKINTTIFFFHLGMCIVIGGNIRSVCLLLV